MAEITIVNYGMGNIGSVANAFRRLGATWDVASSPAQVRTARALVLPGVGAFRSAMRNIRELALAEALTDAVLTRRVPFLGICLGLQLIAEESSEGGPTQGLGWIPGEVRALEPAGELPVPHVGWNQVEFLGTAPLFNRIDQAAHFYFDHGYALRSGDSVVTATCDYGGRCVAAVQRDNIYAVQFHPEKSQRNGLRVLRNFLTIAASYATADNRVVC
ncbi:MAG: imidazole glycerol phosphate synthase subunit HisH [Vicinamibacterales bacterium]